MVMLLQSMVHISYGMLLVRQSGAYALAAMRTCSPASPHPAIAAIE
jgi:hypothetical protein